MKIPGIPTIAAILFLGVHVRARDAPVVPPAGSDPPPPDLAKMLATFQQKGPGIYPDNPLDQPDFDEMCLVSMETKNGGQCFASVYCKDHGTIEYNKEHHTWNACFVGGRQFFADPRIGDFSIMFAEKNGTEQGQGLTTPVFQVKNLGDWLEVPVEGVAKERRKKQKCDAHKGHKEDCGKGPMPCERNPDPEDPKPFAKSKKKQWQCLIPYKKKIKKASSPAGVALTMPNSKAPNFQVRHRRNEQRREDNS